MNYKFETVSCCICGSEESELISTQGKFNLPTNVVLCTRCGLGYLNPRWNGESYLEFYREEYDNFYRPGIGNKSSQQKPNPIVERLKPGNYLLKNNANILDIGCGPGHNLFAVGNCIKNSQLYAIEPSEKSGEILKKEGVKLISDNVDTDWDKEFTEQFDIVIMRHVLEHFMNPLDVMRKVQNVIADDGILYLAVPDSLHPTQNLEKGWFRNVHTYYFNKYTLTNLMSIAGFNIQQITEGDKYAKGEVFVVASKGSPSAPSNISSEHFIIQKNLFKKQLKKEKTILFKFIKVYRKIESVFQAFLIR